MKYRIFFTNGENFVISEDDAKLFVDLLLENSKEKAVKKEFHVTQKLQVINVNFYTHLMPEVEGTESAVITPRTPATIKQEEERKRQEIIGDPKKVLTDIQHHDENVS